MQLEQSYEDEDDEDEEVRRSTSSGKGAHFRGTAMRKTLDTAPDFLSRNMKSSRGYLDLSEQSFGSKRQLAAASSFTNGRNGGYPLQHSTVLTVDSNQDLLYDYTSSVQISSQLKTPNFYGRYEARAKKIL